MPIALIIIGLAALAVLGCYLIATPAAEPPKRARRRAPHNIPPAPCLRSTGFLARHELRAMRVRAAMRRHRPAIDAGAACSYMLAGFIVFGCILVIVARILAATY